MPKAIRAFVRWVDAVNKKVGYFSMYLVFAMTGVLLYESLSRTLLDRPHIWVVEVAQFIMAAYYLLGGGYSMILKGHVRMDLLYGRWSVRKQAVMDLITMPFLLFYLIFLLWGGLSSLQYAIEYQQVNYTSWAPVLWPIKLIMVIGIVLMLLQAIATFFKDLEKAIKGEETT